MAERNDELDSWITNWERQCIEEVERAPDLESQIQNERDTSSQKLWLLFQNSATCVAQLYKGTTSRAAVARSTQRARLLRSFAVEGACERLAEGGMEAGVPCNAFQTPLGLVSQRLEGNGRWEGRQSRFRLFLFVCFLFFYIVARSELLSMVYSFPESDSTLPQLPIIAK
ncbi:hypothetical protein HPB48_018293 [Haemaphysalis longicornis]|uniref:Uncharacterized protein n=1 Tax=Haemaphysalis longicornis TaxID=44386 RepID=A0A9J6FSR2_HAELO|nr:hypothetical protein HPB48_018293 [Haemaphysalis longicornis]